MAKKQIPSDVRRLILRNLPSIPHLEALMLLHASAPASWSAPDLARRLYVAPAKAREVLDYLRRAGMLRGGASPSSYLFSPRREELRHLIDTLALLYSSHLVEITLLIHAKLDRVAHHRANAAGAKTGT
ncbi:hypothetical protein [Massilia pseudoviolaceinigra]|uniref:hypothetical protein n=1 Tax=Massilia pseudoviolaceinigra TaxID=3057165 RepID=UPI0027964256|nr:hypothetical protein [Massilia sp. CCM 9206]MDQ1921553.1 hypothetical protein [Massilia sp. CCM 9206]